MKVKLKDGLLKKKHDFIAIFTMDYRRKAWEKVCKTSTDILMKYKKQDIQLHNRRMVGQPSLTSPSSSEKSMSYLNSGFINVNFIYTRN